MTEQELLQKAYVTFGLEYGASFEAIKRRYKRLIMVWHPDRFPNAEGKKDAEEELKRINDAKDRLFAHFEKNHRESGPCSCREQPRSGSTTGDNRSSPGTGAGPGPGKRRTTQENDREESEASKRNEERARRAASETAEKQRQAHEAATAAAAHKQTVEDALTQQKRLQEEQLRWKIAVGLCAAWIGLSVYGWAGVGIKNWWHDLSWKWQRGNQSVQPQVNNTTPEKTPYIEPYNKFPGGNQTTWQQQQADQRRRDEEAERKKKQDIYDTRSALDRYQKTIDHCNAEIAKVDAQLADPAVSDYEKNKSISYQNAQRGYLAEAQANLAEAQKRFTELTGTPASQANLTEWGPNSSATITPSNPETTVPGSTVAPLMRTSPNLFPSNSNTGTGSNFGLNSPLLKSLPSTNGTNTGLVSPLVVPNTMNPGSDLSTVRSRAHDSLNQNRPANRSTFGGNSQIFNPSNSGDQNR